MYTITFYNSVLFVYVFFYVTGNYFFLLTSRRCRGFPLSELCVHLSRFQCVMNLKVIVYHLRKTILNGYSVQFTKLLLSAVIILSPLKQNHLINPINNPIFEEIVLKNFYIRYKFHDSEIINLIVFRTA